MDQIDQKLAELREARTGLDLLYEDKAAKDAAAAAALAEQDASTTALNTGIAEFNDREAAFVALINSTFTSGPPIPPAPPEPAPVPPADTITLSA